jgi:hypothetical protein
VPCFAQALLQPLQAVYAAPILVWERASQPFYARELSSAVAASLEDGDDARRELLVRHPRYRVEVVGEEGERDVCSAGPVAQRKSAQAR